MGNKTQKLRNLGPASWSMLSNVGIDNVEMLQQIGAVAAFLKIEMAGGHASLNLLYAMVAGLADKDWRDFTSDEKGALNRELEDLREHLLEG